MSGTKIINVEATWVNVPISCNEQHVSDFGRISSFDMTLVKITLENGLRGYGEAKAAVGSQGSCVSLAYIIEQEMKPQLVGQDACSINAIWSQLYNGARNQYAVRLGRSFHVLGRRGLWVSAMSGIDLALWDIAGKLHDVPVLQLLGGAVKDAVPGYASGGWAGTDGIGPQLQSYVNQGFNSVKMRVGVMDTNVRESVARVSAAREHLGSDVEIMVDAHGTFDVKDARAFCEGVADCGIRWFEEPLSADNRKSMGTLKNATSIPISMGESEFTVFDFQDLVDRDAADILQPDMAICGGLTEGTKISALAVANQLELAPHCWGSAFSFAAGLTLAFLSPACRIVEYSLGTNPLLSQLVHETFDHKGGLFSAPNGSGWGLSVNEDFVKEFAMSGEA